MGVGVVLAFRMQPESKFALDAAEKAHVSSHLGA
jgi:hypothetical protein